jgi:hypothetical protein
MDSRNVTVSDCIFDTDDDALCFKTDGERPCENVTVTNCVLASNCNAIKMKTSGLAGYRNITISNCVIRKASEENFRHWRPLNPTITSDTTALAGIALELVDGCVMDQITISTITMTGVQTPIFIKLGNRCLHLANPPVAVPGILRNVLISNIVATSESLLCNSITGMPGSYEENVVIKDALLNCPGGGTRHIQRQVLRAPGSRPSGLPAGAAGVDPAQNHLSIVPSQLPARRRLPSGSVGGPVHGPRMRVGIPAR